MYAIRREKIWRWQDDHQMIHVPQFSDRSNNPFKGAVTYTKICPSNYAHACAHTHTHRSSTLKHLRGGGREGPVELCEATKTKSYRILSFGINQQTNKKWKWKSESLKRCFCWWLDPTGNFSAINVSPLKYCNTQIFSQYTMVPEEGQAFSV